MGYRTDGQEQVWAASDFKMPHSGSDAFLVPSGSAIISSASLGDGRGVYITAIGANVFWSKNGIDPSFPAGPGESANPAHIILNAERFFYISSGDDSPLRFRTSGSNSAEVYISLTSTGSFNV